MANAAGADVERVKREIEEVIGIDCSNAILASAKQVSLEYADVGCKHTVSVFDRTSSCFMLPSAIVCQTDLLSVMHLKCN